LATDHPYLGSLDPNMVRNFHSSEAVTSAFLNDEGGATNVMYRQDLRLMKGRSAKNTSHIGTSVQSAILQSLPFTHAGSSFGAESLHAQSHIALKPLED